MTRGACLLLLLLSSWLFAQPGLRLNAAACRATVVADASREASAVAGEHLISQTATPEVARAPLLARLPLGHVLGVVEGPRSAHAWSAVVGDRRDAVRRVQLRRRLPRLGDDDPPWS
jgi:hypothetical protein